MPNLKYQTLIDEVRDLGCNCPPANLKDTNLRTFRYIFETDIENKSHWPNRKKSPKRQLKNDAAYCSSCGLSCYDTETNAINFFNKLLSNNQNIYKNIGDSLAVGDLKPEHGVMTDIDPLGHFDFYEYEDFVPENNFTFVVRLLE